MRILGIETSCDETSVAILQIKNGILTPEKNLVYSQIKIHQKYGGVVPEVAARRHVEKIIQLVKSLWPLKIDAIAVTAGPGLATALLVGVETARALSHLLKLPLIRINHMEGHIYGNWLEQKLDDKKIFPALCLIVSGGHTELILMKNHGRYKLIGQTRDDAAGECFDKVGKILGLPYPGGPLVAKLAIKGNPLAINLPRPMLDSGDFDFSFSGLKTAVLYYTQKQKNFNTADVCASFQQAAVEVLVTKTIVAAKKYKVKTMILGGGVAANKSLQEKLSKAVKKELPNTIYNPLNTEYCGDNAVMIAATGYFHYLKKDFTPWQKIKINPNWELI